MQTMRSDLAGCPVIIGGGLAGLMTALRLAPRRVVARISREAGDQGVDE
jgi:L-aspartate oxidase